MQPYAFIEFTELKPHRQRVVSVADLLGLVEKGTGCTVLTKGQDNIEAEDSFEDVKKFIKEAIGA